jgi:SPP1 gp7 family putative phage head morphogenesis protein
VTTVRPVRPNAGTRQRYYRQMVTLIREMATAVEEFVLLQRRIVPPVMASDASPASEMEEALRKIFEQWQGRFDGMAAKVAKSFVENQWRGVDSAFRQALRDAGWSVQFTLTPAMRDALDAMIAENVGLIRSIPARYLEEVQGIVMRNYADGHNIKAMAKEIRSRYGVASRRAMLIARDQTSKCYSITQRVRMQEVGVKEAIWLHSHGGRTPRPTHVAMDHKRFRLDKGMWDSAEKKWIYPSELINCRCVSRAVLPFTPV